jgi:hypothetical protein
VQDGDTIGGGGYGPIVGYEADGALFDWSTGLPVVRNVQSTPPGLTILGISPAGNKPPTDHHATMGLFRHPGGGWVFNAGTVYWSWGLLGLAHPDAVVDRITRNVLDRFTTNVFPPQITGWTPARVVTDTVMHEPYPYRLQDIVVAPGSSLNFSMSASDPYQRTLSYAWYTDGERTGTQNTFQYATNSNAQFGTTIAAVVNNGLDSATVTWRVFVPLLRDLRQSNSDTLTATIQDDTSALAYVLQRGPALSATGLVRQWTTVDSQFVATPIGGTRTLYFLAIPDQSPYFAFRIKRYALSGHVSYSNSVYHGSGIARYRALAESDLLYVYQSYPQPGRNTATIDYVLNRDCDLSLVVYDLLGRVIRPLVREQENPGLHQVVWDTKGENGTPVSSGLYFARIRAQAGSKVQVKTNKIILLR